MIGTGCFCSSLSLNSTLDLISGIIGAISNGAIVSDLLSLTPGSLLGFLLGLIFGLLLESGKVVLSVSTLLASPLSVSYISK